MNSVRPKSAVFKFKVWPQKRSQNLSYNPAQTLLRNLPISRVLEGNMTWNWVGGRKRQFPTTFMKKPYSNSNGNNDIASRQELEGYPPRQPASLLSILAISRALVIQMLWNFMGEKIRWFPTTLLSILAISRALVIQILWNFMGGKIRWFPTTFIGTLYQILIASMSFHPAKMLECCCPPSPLNQ